jgi:hypothetical protein
VEEAAPPTEEQEEEETVPPTEEQEVENYRKYWEMCFGCRYGSYDAESKKFSTLYLPVKESPRRRAAPFARLGHVIS